MASICQNACSSINFNCTSEDQVGNILLSRFYTLEQQGALQDNTANGVVTTIIAYGITTASNTCSEAFEGDQTIDLECTNTETGTLVRNTGNCKNCRENIATLIQDRLNMEKRAHQLNPGYVEQVPSPALLSQLKGADGSFTDGVCAYVCDQCVAMNVDQTLQLSITETCDVSTRSFRSAFVSGMIDQAAVEITRHQNALNATGASIQKKEDISSLAVHVANTIQQITTTNVLNTVKSQALAAQRMVITPESTSVVLQNVKQNLTINMVTSMVSQMYSDQILQGAINYSIYQEQIKLETDYLDLLKDIELSVEKMSQLLAQTVGKIMISIVAILMILVMIFAGIFFVKPSFMFGGVFEDEDNTGLEE